MEIKKALWLTKEFFFLRLAVSVGVAFVYILLAAGIQDLAVRFLGESAFNYIIGGLCSLFVSIPIASYLGKLFLILIRGSHVSALAYINVIDEKGLSSLDTGNHMFRKHMTSFALIYGVALMIDKAAKSQAANIWDMFDGVPMADQLKKFCNSGLVKMAARGIIRTTYDAVIYYIVRYTKEGISDDLPAIPKAIKSYLYALPSIVLTSIPSFLVLNVLPPVVSTFVVLGLIASKGFVAGILMMVLIWPVSFILRKAALEPAMTVALLTCYGNKCVEEETGEANEVVKGIVDAIIESVGLSGFDEDDGEDPSAATDGDSDESNEDKEENPATDWAASMGAPRATTAEVADDIPNPIAPKPNPLASFMFDRANPAFSENIASRNLKTLMEEDDEDLGDSVPIGSHRDFSAFAAARGKWNSEEDDGLNDVPGVGDNDTQVNINNAFAGNIGASLTGWNSQGFMDGHAPFRSSADFGDVYEDDDELESTPEGITDDEFRIQNG